MNVVNWYREYKMRSFWSEFLTAAANHPFTALPGDFLATYDTYHDYYDDDDDDCMYFFGQLIY